MLNSFINPCAFLIGVIFLLINFVSSAQQNNQGECGAEIPSQQWENEFQKLISEFKTNRLNGKAATSTYTIPIIFHIIHGGEPIGTYPNLYQGQINSQITVLNQDFSGNGLYIENYPVNAFINWAINQSLPSSNLDPNGRVKIADFTIQFCLAIKDTLGNILAEPGIDRISYIQKGWLNPNLFMNPANLLNYLDNTIKPQSIWDVTKYLNIWVTDKHNAIPYTGASTMPPFSGLPGVLNTATETTDGIWCYGKTLGSYFIFPGGSYSSPGITGRTVTHEAGHYLGLRHIWGDASCATDYCDDTPPAYDQNTGTPAYPYHVGTCSSPSNIPDGEMFMNFMDYTIGPSKYMFTIDQMDRAQTAMLNSPFRNQLGTHGLCLSSGFDLDISVFLEGPYESGQMNNALNIGNELPLAQPYNVSPWNYQGTESATVIPNLNVVDWVLIEIRDAFEAYLATGQSIIAQKAAFLLKDGSVVETDGNSIPNFNLDIHNGLFAVIHHRNHISVMSSVPVTESGGVYTYNFNSGEAQAYGGVLAQKELSPGVWGMVAADGNADNQVSNFDKNNVWQLQAGSSGYKSGDFNLDGQVSNVDKNNVWKPNTGRGGQVPE